MGHVFQSHYGLDKNSFLGIKKCIFKAFPWSWFKADKNVIKMMNSILISDDLLRFAIEYKYKSWFSAKCGRGGAVPHTSKNK